MPKVPPKPELKLALKTFLIKGIATTFIWQRRWSGRRQRPRRELAACAGVGPQGDRVGVPRDMKYPAARQLRAHLNWFVDALEA